MRIDRFELLAYGPFTDHALDFSGDDAGLHVVFGNNEAGKSTCLRALTAWLFGFPHSVPDTQVHHYNQLRLGGVLRLASGQTLAFHRRKGNKDTLRVPGSDEALPDEALGPFLPGLDEPLFTRIYGIDHERLVEGGRDILRQSGDIGQALFSAALGSAGLRALAERLEHEAAELFLPRSPKRTLNLALSEFKGAQKALGEARLPVREFRDLQRDVQKTADEIARVEEEVRQHALQLGKLRRVKRVLGAAAERRGLLAQREAEGELPRLPPSLAEDRHRALEAHRVAVEALDRAELKLERRRAELEALEIRAGFLEHRETIEAIQRELGAVEKALFDKPRHDGKRRMLRNEARELLKSIRPDLDVDSAEPLRLVLNNRRWIEELARKYELQQQRAARLAADQLQYDRACASLDPALTSGEAEREPTALRAAAAAARRAGDLDDRIQKAARAVAEHGERCQQELARLGRYEGELGPLLRTPFPSGETLDRFERAFDEADQRRRDRRRDYDELVREREQTARDLQSLIASRAVPSEAELTAARATRDEAWLALTQQLTAPTARPDTNLLLRIERAIRHADHLADLLRANAADVQRRTQLEDLLGRIDQRVEALKVEAREATEERTTLLDGWNRLWTGTGVSPGVPREMRQWLAQVDRLRGMTDALTQAEREREHLTAARQALLTPLQTALELSDAATPTLASLLDLADRRLTEYTEALERRRLAARQLRDLEHVKDRLSTEHAAVEAEREQWRANWARALADLHLGPDDPPVKVLDILSALVSLFDKLDQAAELGRRMYGIDVVQSTFDTRVREFVQTLGLDFPDLSTSEIAERLVQERDQALVTASRSDNLQAELREIADEAAEARLAVLAASSRLAAMRERAGVETDEALELAIQRSAARIALLERLELVERELVRAGDGRTITELLAEVESVDPDILDDEIQRVTDALARLQSERDQLRYQHKSLEDRLASLDGSARAAQASEEAEQHLATIVASSRDYLRLKLASAILTTQIERYRQQNQAPVLRRASALFQRLTLGSFTGLRDELDDNGRPVLLGLRAGDQEVRVDGMSDGTRDQLFLSLRLATLEQHLGRSEPMPFVVDDILVTFDDLRTRACLDVLAELSQRTQVLVFTHHQRVVELAHEMPPSARVRTHALTR